MTAFPQAEDWASEFAESTVFSFLPDGVKEGAPSVCAEFVRRLRDSTEAELRRVLLEEMPTLDLPPKLRPALPGIYESFFDWLEDTGRLGGGRSFARFVGALRPAYADRCSPRGGLRVPSIIKKTPDIGRNDPCPCGSGRKFKKCCAT